MQKDISFTPEHNTFENNIFTFDSDDEQPYQDFQTQNYSSSIPHYQVPKQTNICKQNEGKTPYQGQIFTFDEEDQQQIVQQQQSQNTNDQTSPQYSLVTKSTQGNEEPNQSNDLTDLKNRILFKQQNYFIQKNTPAIKQSPLPTPYKSHSKPQAITKNFEQKVNQLKSTMKQNNLKNPAIKQNNLKDPVMKKIPSDKASIKSKLSQAYLKRSSNNHNPKNNSNDENQFDAFKENKPEGKIHKHYEIQGAKIVNDQNQPNQQFQYVEQQKAIKVTNLRQFLFTQLAEEYKVNALITKIQDGGFLGKLVNKTKYVVTIQQNNKFLFSVTKDGFNKFIFSMNKDDCSQKNKNYLGQLLSKDFSNTEFILYDNGFDPKETKCLEYCFKQMASIKYEEGSGPRKFSAIVSTNSKGFHTIESQVNILEKKWSEKKERKNLAKLYSKQPEFDENDGNYKLDFKGMVGKPSVKNFVLSSDDFEDCLIFARRSNDTYALEVKHPFSLVQAVAICMSSIYHKTIL